ncbi:conserved hypothetical protein [metagenome]|uniref:SnoaL-like domain-containing protein n=1 Tax=metagenome TaxID=256318 RepID=A0A2P2C317_9ZZZZ
MGSMTDQAALLTAVDAYFRALHGCDTDLLDTVFHPDSSLFDVDEGSLRVDPYPSWRQDVAARPSPASVGQSRQDEVVNITWLSADSATVHVRLRILDEVFVDHLSLMREGDAFTVVAKMWHLESRV